MLNATLNCRDSRWLKFPNQGVRELKSHYFQRLIGLVVGFGAWIFHRGPLLLLFVGSSTVSASPTVNCTQFQLGPHSQKSLPGLPKLEAEAAFWQVDLATDSQHITTATLHTTATLRESSVTSVPLPAQGHFIVTLTSGTAHHPMYHDGPELPDGTVG
jgi:hypothetical protein